MFLVRAIAFTSASAGWAYAQPLVARQRAIRWRSDKRYPGACSFVFEVEGKISPT